MYYLDIIVGSCVTIHICINAFLISLAWKAEYGIKKKPVTEFPVHRLSWVYQTATNMLQTIL